MKLKLKKLSAKNLSNIGSLFFLVLFSAYLLIAGFIALPALDQRFELEPYDLVTKNDQYWSKSYIVAVSTGEDSVWEMEKTRSIIHKRLSEFGVEDIKIFETSFEPATPDTRYLRVTVTTSKAEDAVEALLSIRGFFRFYVPNSDVDFYDPENQLAAYSQENYTSTDFTRYSFRNIHVTQLETSSGEDAYFAVFKPWPHTSRQFNRMMEDNAGGLIGLELDGIISPNLVSNDFLTERVDTLGEQSSTVRPEFSIGLSEDEEVAEVYGLLYNSGVIPVNISLVNSEQVASELNQIKHLEVFGSIAIGLIASLAYMTIRGWRSKEELYLSLITIVSVSVTYLAYLKLFQIEIDLEVLLLQVLFILIANIAIKYQDYFSYSKLALLLTTLTSLYILSDGQSKELLSGILLLTIINIFAVYLSQQYKNKLMFYMTR